RASWICTTCGSARRSTSASRSTESSANDYQPNGGPRGATGGSCPRAPDARAEMEALERAELHDPMRRADGEAHLFAALRARWGREYYEAIARLHEMSKTLDERAASLGKSYATSMLMPLLAACTMHRRAYEKPL